MRVRRALGVAVALLLPGVPSLATAPTARVVTVSYQLPAGETTGSGAYVWGSPVARDTARSDEDAVTVSDVDRSGPVALAVDLTHRGATRRSVVCAPLRLAVTTGDTVAATPLAGRCPDGTVSAPTGGQVTLSFHKRPPKPKPRGAPPSMRWAVLVGINDYAGRTHSTVGGLGDVAVIHKALLAAGWRDDHILVVRGDQATRANIRWAFGWLAQHSTQRTFSYFHFSGHVCISSRGGCPSGHTYLWAQDNRFIPETEVRSRMAQVRGYSWLDIAGCEAGAFDIHSTSRLFTASSRPSETSYESPDWRESYWSGLVWDRGFLQGYADDMGKARRATITEMLAYGRRQAPVLTRKGQRGPQHPVVLGGRPNWTLYLPPGG